MHEYLIYLYITTHTTLFYCCRKSCCDDSCCNHQPQSKGSVADLHGAVMLLLPAECVAAARRKARTWVKVIKTTGGLCLPASARWLQYFVPLRRACSDKEDSAWWALCNFIFSDSLFFFTHALSPCLLASVYQCISLSPDSLTDRLKTHTELSRRAATSSQPVRLSFSVFVYFPYYNGKAHRNHRLCQTTVNCK